jgi:lysophospholipase L1-like esterase
MSALVSSFALSGQACTASNDATLRPDLKIVVLGDSITAGPVPIGWAQELANYCHLVYGDRSPTFVNMGTGGINIANTVDQGKAAAAIAQNPDMLFIELGTNDEIPGVTRASIKASADYLLSTLRAGLPTIPMVWVGPWAARSENWGPDPLQNRMDAVQGGIQDSAPAFNVQYVEVRSTQQVDEMTNNTPAPGITPGINTIDGTHPNWRGRPLYGNAFKNRMLFTDKLFPDLSPTWQPDADVTPFLWIEADQLSLADASLVASWSPFTASGAARPTYRKTGWFNGGPAVQFDGVANVMTAVGLSTPAGAKTIFMVYALANAAVGFGNYFSLLSLPSSPGVTTEWIPSFTGGTSPPITVNFDALHSGGDGFFSTGTGDVADGSAGTWPVRLGATWAGGSSTDPANLHIYWGGGSQACVQQNTFLAQFATALPALGARVNDGVTATNFTPALLTAVIAYPGVLTTVQFYRVDQYLRRKWGP